MWFYVIPLSVFAYCYARIFHVIRRQKKVTAAHAGRNQNIVMTTTSHNQNAGQVQQQAIATTSRHRRHHHRRRHRHRHRHQHRHRCHRRRHRHRHQRHHRRRHRNRNHSHNYNGNHYGLMTTGSAAGDWNYSWQQIVSHGVECAEDHDSCHPLLHLLLDSGNNRQCDQDTNGLLT